MTKGHRGRRAQHRGFVLLIVLVVGAAAGLAALSLLSTRGGAEIAAIHSEVGDRSRVIAEAGMQRAMFYLNDIAQGSGDFDAALDTDLDNDCSSGADDDDLRPDTSADADDAVEWTDGTMEDIGGRKYTCVPFGGGRYCVSFQDDDDDGIENDDWSSSTGNNEGSGGSCDSGGCLEGPAGAVNLCGNDNGGDHNPLRDRNRSVWVTSIGIVPDGVDYDDATHKATLRRIYTAPYQTNNAGISIKGNLEVKSGASKWAACSDIAGIAVDGWAELRTAKQGCTSGWSDADDWKGHEFKCIDTGACSGLNFDGPITINPIDGGHRTPGPALPDMPDPWDNANEWIDFGRECVFWLDWGGAHSLDAINGTIDANQIWWWDADENRGPNDLPCSEFEKRAPPDARMPGPPDPSESGKSGDETDPADWAGCWSPLFLDMGTPTAWPYAGSGSADVNIGGSPAHTEDIFECWHIPLHDAANNQIPPERALAGGGTCQWMPSNNAGEYTVCDAVNLAECTAFGEISGATSNSLFDPVNQRLFSEGFPLSRLFPAGQKISKPDWSTCQVEYPPPGTIVNGATVTPSLWNCTTCDGTNPIMEVKGGGPWFMFADHSDVTAVPAGVYHFTGSPGLFNGNGWEWGANATDGADQALPWLNLDEWPLMTIHSDGEMRFQKAGYTFGIGQAHPGEGNGGRDSRWARSASFIIGDELEVQGGGGAGMAGSVYAQDGASWEGNGDIYMFGQLYSNKSFTLNGGGTFYWLYQVNLGQLAPGASAGALPTQSFVSQ